MPQYRIISDYGTFEITKVVDADSEDEAWEDTGIMSDLIEAGWDFYSSPDGEHHEIHEVKP